MASVADILAKAKARTAQNGINPPPVEPEPPALAPEASAVPTTPAPAEEPPKRRTKSGARVYGAGEQAEDRNETVVSLLNQCARLQECAADISRTAAALLARQ